MRVLNQSFGPRKAVGVGRDARDLDEFVGGALAWAREYGDTPPAWPPYTARWSISGR